MGCSSCPGSLLTESCGLSRQRLCSLQVNEVLIPYYRPSDATDPNASTIMVHGAHHDRSDETGPRHSPRGRETLSLTSVGLWRSSLSSDGRAPWPAWASTRLWPSRVGQRSGLCATSASKSRCSGLCQPTRPSWCVQGRLSCVEEVAAMLARRSRIAI